MRLYGKALANQIPDTTTGHQARLMFGAMTSALQGAYQTLASWDSTGVAQWTGLDAGAVAAARQYLDGTNDMLGKYFPDMPASDATLTTQQLAELRTAASGSSVAVKEIDELFGTSWLSELVDAIIEACATVSSAIANTVAKVGGSFLGGIWWVLLLVVAVLVFVPRVRRLALGGLR
jgi:hypothetical protein